MTKLRASDGFNLGEFKVGDGAAGVASDGTSVWVVAHGDNQVVKLNPADGGIVATYLTGKGPFAVVVGGSQIWVPNFSSNSVSRTLAN